MRYFLTLKDLIEIIPDNSPITLKWADVRILPNGENIVDLESLGRYFDNRNRLLRWYRGYEGDAMEKALSVEVWSFERVILKSGNSHFKIVIYKIE